MPTFPIDLSPELDSFVRDRVKSGRFVSVSEVVSTALKAMEQKEQYSAERLEALRAAIDEGDASGIAEGDVFAQIRAELQLSPNLD
jgi:antitoxin ParD1/3/4